MVTYRVWAIAALAGLCAVATPCFAQEDAENSKDHPMFSRLPGYCDEVRAQNRRVELVKR